MRWLLVRSWHKVRLIPSLIGLTKETAFGRYYRLESGRSVSIDQRGAAR